MSTKFKDSKLLHEKRRRLNYETPSFLLILFVISYSDFEIGIWRFTP